MREGASGGGLADWAVGIFVGVLGLIGLVLASGAMDDEIYIFGLSVAAFAVLFDFGLIRAAYDRASAAKAVRP